MIQPFQALFFRPHWLTIQSILLTAFVLLPCSDSQASALQLAESLLGTPYRDDGTTDACGRYTLFSQPDQSFDTPGLNCSGLVLTLARELFDRPFSIEETLRDRDNNSGPNAPSGQDWDLGLDIILNLTDGLPRRIILPQGSAPVPDHTTDPTLSGFPLHDETAWAAVLPQLQPGKIYLTSLNKAFLSRPGVRVHSHVGLILPDQYGQIWFFHAGPKGGVQRMDLATPRGMARFRKNFSETWPGRKWFLILEAPIVPGRTTALRVQSLCKDQTRSDAL